MADLACTYPLCTTNQKTKPAPRVIIFTLPRMAIRYWSKIKLTSISQTESDKIPRLIFHNLHARNYELGCFGSF